MSWKSWEQTSERGPGPLLLRVSIFVGLALACFAIVGFCVNPWRQASRIVAKTIDADNVLYNYEWYKQRQQDLQSLDAKVASANETVAVFKDECGPRSEWKREDREESARLGAVALGLGQQRNDMAAEYNARVTMANRAIFKSGELPDSVVIDK